MASPQESAFRRNPPGSRSAVGDYRFRMKESTSASNFPLVGFLLALITLLGVVILVLPEGFAAAEPRNGYLRANYVLPTDVLTKGLSFAQVRIPLERKEVSLRIVDQLNYLLMDRRATMMEWFDRMALFGPTIDEVLSAEKVPADMLYLAVLLSELLPNAKSKTGGVGWWAIGSNGEKKNRSMARWLETGDWDDRRDPVLSTRIACTVLHALQSRKETNDWLLAICAYLDGIEKIDAIVKKTPGFSYWDLVVPQRSETIVPRVVALKIIDTHRELYGVNITTPDPLAYDSLGRLKLRKDLPLHLVAKWCGTNPRQMWELNPGVNPAAGILPKADNRNHSGFPLRVPKGMGPKVRILLTRESYLDR